LVAASVALGNNQRTRRAHVATLVERAERLEHERDQQAQIAAAAERTRIAREMHDVIAHSLAVIVALADGATAKLEAEPERAGRAIRDISDVGRQALGDTRRLLGILRTEQSDDGFAPQPGIEQISELLSQVRSTGLDADLTVEGTILAIPPGAELTAYRIVQEAITNTLKHASGATKVQARVRYLPPHLEILVTDDGRGRLPGGATTSSGHGLIGMRERVAPYGGTVEAGQGPTGGWTVRATIRVTDSTGAPS
jgi:signal transduction histidine kinase